MPLTPRDGQSSQLSEFFSSTSPRISNVSDVLLSGTQDLTQSQSKTNDLLLRLIEQLKVSDARMSTFIESQQRTNDEINDKLNQLNRIADQVERNCQRITELERESAALAREVSELKTTLSAPLVRDEDSNSNKLIISGVPAALSVSSDEFVKNVFRALDIPNLLCHVLNVRAVVRGPLLAVAGSKPLTPSDTTSLIVTLASAAVRDIVIAKKRSKRTLTQEEVCGDSSERKIYVNELLSKVAYDLLQQTKRTAKQKSYKYVWVSSGRICVRRADGDTIVHIDNAADLAKLI
ncbi:uncharacterized protein LOC112461431 [Temnothorax curvispinosus]|uniref:Uncharacterized protein LOC112461431 n=1 Tax=Temnothorax curvispinosus TaxID=300111 RepID=A0A6J1QKL3_9HYME|nr:uncharacterized protein LOC112461431 [Temnothorax curvispinosus]